MTKENSPASSIAFGLNRETDEKSLATFVQRFSREDLLATIIPRMSDAEIEEILDFLTLIMHKHLSEPEYHRLFMKG